MLVNLDQIEFYHGPLCQNPRSEFSRPEGSSLRSRVSLNLYLTLFLFGPISTPDSPALTLSANRPEPFTLQSHSQLSTSRAEPCNAFDVELGKLYNGIERPQFENVVTAGGDNSCVLNGGLGYDDLVSLGNGSSGSGKLNDFPGSYPGS
jgi:hypothetical protein